jgi:hypothetical protein
MFYHFLLSCFCEKRLRNNGKPANALAFPSLSLRLLAGKELVAIPLPRPPCLTE